MVKSIIQNTKQKFTKKSDNQNFYYHSFAGILLGSKARAKLIEKEMEKLNKNKSFLEVGCAQGYYLAKALEKTNNVFGIDITKDFIELAKKTGANAKIASGEKLPCKKEKFDFGLCTETLEHIPNWKKAVKEIKRVLKKNGKVIITIPLEKKSLFWRTFSLIHPPEKTRGHINLFSSEQIEKEFSDLKLIEKKFIQTPSLTLNKILPKWEQISMYCFYEFKK
jgi:ubiquinone/menaquinone biosynthesis C-methylase UbiE